MNSALLPSGLARLSRLPRSNLPYHSALPCVEWCLLRRSLLRQPYSPRLLPCRGSRRRLLRQHRLRCCPSAADHHRSQAEYPGQPRSLATSLAAALHARLSALRVQTVLPEPSLHLPWLARLLALRALLLGVFGDDDLSVDLYRLSRLRGEQLTWL